MRGARDRAVAGFTAERATVSHAAMVMDIGALFRSADLVVSRLYDLDGNVWEWKQRL